MVRLIDHVGIQGGGTGSPDPPPPPPPLKNHKNIGFLSNTGLDPLKITKLPSKHSMLGHHWHASETPFKWLLLAVRLWPAYSGIWIGLDPLSPKKKPCHSWIPSDKTFWICAWIKHWLASHTYKTFILCFLSFIYFRYFVLLSKVILFMAY